MSEDSFWAFGNLVDEPQSSTMCFIAWIELILITVE